MKAKLLSMLTAGAVIFSAGISSQAMAAGGKAVTLNIASMGEQMMYDKKELSVPADSKVTVIFQNKSTSLKHNWVLVKLGTGNKVATAGIGLGESQNYVPKTSDVIASTKLSAPGKKVQVTFQAPKKGSYDFVCTSPGHNVMMKGKFTVK